MFFDLWIMIKAGVYGLFDIILHNSIDYYQDCLDFVSKKIISQKYDQIINFKLQKYQFLEKDELKQPKKRRIALLNSKNQFLQKDS